jgi:hypothetical protein
LYGLKLFIAKHQYGIDEEKVELLDNVYEFENTTYRYTFESIDATTVVEPFFDHLRGLSHPPRRAPLLAEWNHLRNLLQATGKAKVHAWVATLQCLHTYADHLTNDTYNARVRFLLTDTIYDASLDNERSVFHRKLEMQKIGLEHTRAWLKEAFTRLPPAVQADIRNHGILKAHSMAIVMHVNSNYRGPLPETLALDSRAIAFLRREFFNLLRMHTVLAVAAVHPTAFEDVTYVIETLDPCTDFDLDKTPLVDKWKQKFKAVLARPLEGSTALFFRRLTTESVLCAMGKRKGPPNIMTLPTPLALQRRLAFYLQHLRNVVRVNLEVYEQTYSDIFMAAAAI